VVVVLFLFLLLALHLLGGRRLVNIVILVLRSYLLLAGSGSLAGGGLLGSWGGGVVGGDVTMAALEVAHDGLAEVLPDFMVSVCTWWVWPGSKVGDIERICTYEIASLVKE
jgi:hypothetical protein